MRHLILALVFALAGIAPPPADAKTHCACRPASTGGSK